MKQIKTNIRLIYQPSNPFHKMKKKYKSQLITN